MRLEISMMRPSKQHSVRELEQPAKPPAKPPHSDGKDYRLLCVH